MMPPPSDRLLRYRAWTGTFRPPVFASIAMARSSLQLLLRRRLFWLLYALAIMIFLFFFYGQYLVVWIQMQTQATNQTVRFAGIPVTVGDLTKFLNLLNLNGTAPMYGNFIWFEGYIAMIVLALAGSVLVGNDFHHGSLPFYLSKPIAVRHYVLGKVLAIGAFVNLMTTFPAIVLYIQAGLLGDWKEYYVENIGLLLGILGYGVMLTIVLGLLLVATAVWMRRTVPLIMVWTSLFVLARTIGEFLVMGQRLDPRWRLIDLWNDLYLVGLWLLGAPPTRDRLENQPTASEAAIVLFITCSACLFLLRNRVRAVEIVK